MKKKEEIFIGMNKSPDRSSICRLGNKIVDSELYIKERFTRVKSDGGVDLSQLTSLLPLDLRKKNLLLAENSYYSQPSVEENRLNSKYPYFEKLLHSKQEKFVSKFNKEISFLTHHYCHARAAAAISPFQKAVIVVMDCSGNAANDFAKNNKEIQQFPPPNKNKRLVTEACTVYLQDGPKLNCVQKNWQTFSDFKLPDQRIIRISNGLGRLYEASSQYIFNSIHESGKVMGLAAFGQASPIGKSRSNFIKNLDWNLAFRKKGKAEWERHNQFRHFANVAASVQNHFEISILNLMKRIRISFPEYNNLIFTGGTALNCVTNLKLLNSGIFDDIYVPPFPGDESISFGAAAHLKFEVAKQTWKPVLKSFQRANFGPLQRNMNSGSIPKLFKDYKVMKLQSVYMTAARLLAEGKLVGWYQGRSESGPRALGNRSILADPRVKNLKAKLNRSIKKRESFRPYGCSCILQKANVYFDVPKNFESPFMSFAPKIRNEFKKTLSQVSHIDGTSRVQTVRQSQNKKFYRLLKEFEKQTGLACILNTSLNVMGEPIVESIEDAQHFFATVAIDALILEDYLILRS